MLDTVRLSAVVPRVAERELLRRGWTLHVSTSPQGEVNARAVWGEEGDPLRLSVLLGVGWLSVECSVPRLVFGDNAAVISSESDMRRGVAMMQSRASDLFGASPVSDWRVVRVDPVWAWPCDPAPYIAALRWARLPRTSPVLFSEGLQWRTKAAVVGRLYDKSVEAGRSVELPLRLERQLRPRRQVVRVNGKRLGVGVEECISWRVCREVLADALHGLGLDAGVPARRTAWERLQERYGARRASTLLGWLVRREVSGLVPKGDPRTVRRIEAELRAAGVTAIAESADLPPLRLPE